jgi:energy-coupling factor transport system substrate-specific component
MMKEVFTMWANTRMIILVALSAAIYAAFLIAFKGGLVIVPGITEVRPANVFPPVFSLLFGPAGAWGAAIGNTIGDLFGGTLGPGSIFGFFGNFFLGFIPYKMWGATFGLVKKTDIAPVPNSIQKIAAMQIVFLTASAACAIVIAWYLDLAGLVPFAFLSLVITFNNYLAAFILAPILLALLYPRVKRWGLMWTDIMDEEEVSGGFARNVGTILVIIGSFGGLIVGVLVGTGLAGQVPFDFAGQTGQVGVWLAVAPFLILLLIGSIMLSGREQFVEEFAT